MRNSKYFLCLVLFVLVVSCMEKHSEVKETSKEQPKSQLPFTSIELDNLSAFKKTTGNWQIDGGAHVDRAKDKALSAKQGAGVLLNIPDDTNKEHLFTKFEHGDMELELDVMMPVNSNSGLYFQGRYEVQLFDSWGVEQPTYTDLGGIYQRWDDTRDVQGYEGHAPKVNAAKAPGLWQHLKIIFHAPKFDAKGKKIKNAWFEEVRLNGELLHENLEVTGPTRASAFSDEKPLGSLMIQGDHGPVAFKNIRYKLYEDEAVSFGSLQMKEYENTNTTIPNLDTLTLIRNVAVDSMSSLMAQGERPQRILVYNGNLTVPKDGDYLFDFKVNRGGGLLLIEKDTVVDLDGDYNLDDPGYATVTLKKGKVPFELIYNKHNGWNRGFTLDVEGPNIQKHRLTAKKSIDLSRGKPANDIMVNVSNETETQRGFFMHEGHKRTHVISVGMPQGVHFAYDLALGALLKVWDGSFLNATQMWHSRGIEQLASPPDFNVSLHGDPEFVFLENDQAVWPDSIPDTTTMRQRGYEFDDSGVPSFSHEINGTVITDRFVPAKKDRGLNRTTTINGGNRIWHKIAEGDNIEALPDHMYVVNDEGYFIDFSGNDELKPIIRHVNGKDELIVEVAQGTHHIDYSIIW